MNTDKAVIPQIRTDAQRAADDAAARCAAAKRTVKHGDQLFANIKTDSRTVARYCEVKLDNGKRIKLRDYTSDSSYLVGIEVNNEGDEIVPKGNATQRQHVIVVNCIKSIIPLRISLKYGTLEPIEA